MGERSGLSIQHNSSVVATHLDPSAAASGVVFASLEDAAKNHAHLLEANLHRAVPTERTRFSALHAAFRTGGTFVFVPRGVSVELPLQTLMYVDRDDLAVFPHTVIVLEEAAELTFIDRYVSPDLTNMLSDAVVELYLGPGSRLRYVSLQDWGRGVTHLAVQRAELATDSELRSLGVTFGASLSRSEVESVLVGESPGSSKTLAAGTCRRSRRRRRHTSPHGGSPNRRRPPPPRAPPGRGAGRRRHPGGAPRPQRYAARGPRRRLGGTSVPGRGQSRTIYSGTVIIQKGAHKCNAYQTNRNILLSEDAKADSIPNLEILSNDPVRCGHAASVGPVDEDTLFYVQSRGIPFEEAQKLVVFGFLQEVLDRVTLAEVRDGLERAIASELEQES